MSMFGGYASGHLRCPHWRAEAIQCGTDLCLLKCVSRFLLKQGCESRRSSFCDETSKWKCDECNMSGWWWTGYNFSLLLSSVFIHTRPVIRQTDGCNKCYTGIGTHTTTLLQFISSTQAVVVQFSVVNFYLVYLDIRFFIRISSLGVFNRLHSFWCHLKGNWVLYDVMCIFDLLGPFT